MSFKAEMTLFCFFSILTELYLTDTKESVMVKYGKIYPVSFGVACGIVNGLAMMLLCLASARWGYGAPVVSMLASIYHNVSATWMGSLWGLVWGFLDGMLFGLFVSMIYNCSLKGFVPSGSCDSCE